MPFMLASVTLPSFSHQQGSLLPLVLIALLLDSGIVSLWYIFGVLLNNSGVKESAKGEFYQLAGTAILIGIIIFLIGSFSTLFESTLNSTALLNSGAISNTCNSISSTSHLSLLQSGGISSILCGVASGNTKAAGPTTLKMDYPLAAAGVVLENLTNQTVTNLNSLFVVDSFIGFESRLSPSWGVCLGFEDEAPGVCLIPQPVAEDVAEPLLQFMLSAAPYAGLTMIYKGFSILIILTESAFYSFTIQLIFVLLFLYAWPILIFAGLILRATMFTRKIGGLLIAVAIGAVFFYPVVFSLQYLVLGNGLTNVQGFGNVLSTNPSSLSSIYGYNTLTTSALTKLPAYPCTGSASYNLATGAITGYPSCSTYTPNFYVLPNVTAIANYYGCWPPSGNSQGAIAAETTDIQQSMVTSPLSLILSLLAGPASSYPILFTSPQCTPPEAEAMLFSLVNSYGMYGINAYFLPILDLLITISAIIGLSGLLGGDTELAGLSKLI